MLYNNNTDMSFWDQLTRYSEEEILIAIKIYENFQWLAYADEETVEKLSWVDESTVINIFKKKFEKEFYLIDSLNDAKTSKLLEGIFYKTQDNTTLYNCTKIYEILFEIIVDSDFILDNGVAFKQIMEKEIEFEDFQKKNK